MGTTLDKDSINKNICTKIRSQAGENIFAYSK